MSSVRTYPPEDRDAHPPLRFPHYRSTLERAPALPPHPIAHTLAERTGPTRFDDVRPDEADLTLSSAGAPLGERIVVSGRVLDGDGGPVPGTLVEIWQANAAGRYAHSSDRHDAPLDPCFAGVGRCVTDADGRYRFTTIKPGAYPWQNHANAWRPAHLHFSLLSGALASRLVTQMYFPGDPLLAEDPIFHSVPECARERLVSRFDLALTEPGRALGYAFDLIVRGRRATPRGL